MFRRLPGVELEVYGGKPVSPCEFLSRPRPQPLLGPCICHH
jgi:hypothetical protein